MEQEMTQDTAEGLLHELGFALAAGWTMHRETSGFRVAPPEAMNVDPVLRTRLRAEVWRLAQFVAYSAFVSIEKMSDSGYAIKSRRDDGAGFMIIIEAAPSSQPDHRPKPPADE